MLCNFRQEFKEVMIDLLGIIAVGLTDKLDGIRQQDMPLCFLSFEPSLFFVCSLFYRHQNNNQSAYHDTKYILPDQDSIMTPQQLWGECGKGASRQTGMQVQP